MTKSAPFPRWYAVYTRPNHERKVDAELRRIGYPTFYPFHRVRRRRKRPNVNIYFVEWIDQPYFTRYLFVALPNQHCGLYSAANAEGVCEIVSYGGSPLEIPHPVIDELMERADQQGLIAEIDMTERKRLSPGERVTFGDNTALAGLVGEVSIDAGKEIRVWLKMFGVDREVSVSPRAIAGIASQRRAVGQSR